MRKIDSVNTEFFRLIDMMGWTQAEAARRLHLSEGSISHYRQGIGVPRHTTMELLKRITLSEYPQALSPGQIMEAAPPYQTSMEASELMDTLRSLSKRDRETVFEVAKFLAYRIKGGPPYIS